MEELLAYRMMVQFLEDRYERLPSDDLGALLGELSLSIWADGGPGDPAIKAEWDRACERVIRSSSVDNEVTPMRRAG